MLEQPLHDGTVEPATEFSTDFSFDTHIHESQGSVKCERTSALSVDSCDDRMESRVTRDVEKTSEEECADTAPVLVSSNVNRVLYRGAISGSIAVGAKCCKPDDALSRVLGNQNRKGTVSSRNPRSLFVHRTWDEVERAGFVLNLVVVDRRNGLGVAHFGCSKRQRLHQAVV